MPLQNGIIASVTLISTLTAGATKREAENILVELRKSEESMRDRLFVLQVWRKYDQETADKPARRKAGEYLDPELAKVLEEREKKMDREKRERETGRNSAIDQNATRVTRHTAAISDRVHQITEPIIPVDVVVLDTGTAEEATEEVMADTEEVEVMVVEVENDREQNKNFISAAIQDIFSNNVQQKSNHYDANIELNFTKNKMFCI